jgi:hypothetical protein
MSGLRQAITLLFLIFVLPAALEAKVLEQLRSRFVCLIFACLTCWPIATQAQIDFDKPGNKRTLPTPYTIEASSEEILDTAGEILESCKITYVKEAKGDLSIGDRLITKYITFTRGVNARTDLAHYSNPPARDVSALTAGRVSLEIIAFPVDHVLSQISITAHFQGQTGGITNGGEGKWVDCPSNGRLEDEVLRGLAGKMLGIDLSIDGNGRRRILDCEY